MEEGIMALIKCPECKHEISDSASICPNCGYPIKQKDLEYKRYLQYNQLNVKLHNLRKYRKLIIFSVSVIIIIISSLIYYKNKVHNPSDILVNGKTLRYSDTKETVQKILGNGLNEELFFRDGFSYGDNIHIIYSADNLIRVLKITDNKVKSFNNISVGDTVDKIKDKYKYEAEQDNLYMVLFNNGKEVNPFEENKSDNWIWINYQIDDNDKVEYIIIYDVLFGQKMR